MIPSLKADRACATFFKDILGAVNWTEHITTTLADPGYVYTSDSLMYINFDNWKTSFEAFLADAANVAAFQRLYPTHVHLLDAARQFCASCDRVHAALHSVRTHHARPDRTDVVRYNKDFERHPEMTVKEHARMHGLTVGQYETWRSHTTPAGHLYLTQVERDTIRNAILAERESAV